MSSRSSPSDPPISDEQRQSLLRLARQAVVAAVGGRPLPEPPEDLKVAARTSRGGAFVSLYRQARLRGCIGHLQSRDSLGEMVIRCAVAAALEDPRFAPLGEDELEGLHIEISVLSRLEAVGAENVQPGTHGLIVQQGPFRGLLLPQVAARLEWSRERFLEETCLKAGLPAGAWKESATRIEVFTAEVFSDWGAGPPGPA